MVIYKTFLCIKTLTFNEVRTISAYYTKLVYKGMNFFLHYKHTLHYFFLYLCTLKTAMRIIGQDILQQQLNQLVESGRIPQAVMLTGNAGVGKLPLAINFAQQIVGDSVQNPEHPDVRFVFPIVKDKERHIAVSNDLLRQFRSHIIGNPYTTIEEWIAKIGEQKAAMIYTEEGAEILKMANMKPYLSDRKVILIWLPELMHESCANKLLKILEEPPLDTTFILVSDTPEQVIGTIKSRCRIIEVPPLNEGDLRNELKKQFEFNEEQTRYLVHACRGSWSNMMQLISKTENAEQTFNLFVKMMRLAWKLDMAEIAQFSKEVAALSRSLQAEFLSNAQRIIRDNFVCHIGFGDLSYMNMEESQFAEKFSRFIHERNIIDISEELALAEAQIRQNVNSEIVIYHTIVKLYIYLHKK